LILFKNKIMLITKKSQVSHKEHTLDIPITMDKYIQWQGGVDAHIQNFFPELNDDQREFLLTGITKEEWNELFSEEED